MKPMTIARHGAADHAARYAEAPANEELVDRFLERIVKIGTRECHELALHQFASVVRARLTDYGAPGVHMWSGTALLEVWWDGRVPPADLLKSLQQVVPAHARVVVVLRRATRRIRWRAAFRWWWWRLTEDPR